MQEYMGSGINYGSTALNEEDTPTRNRSATVGHGLHPENVTKFSRSASVGPGLYPGMLNPEQKSRRALYAELPFLSVAGMHYREHRIAKTLSLMNIKQSGGLITKEDEESASVDVEDVIITWPLVAAVLGAVTLQFLVGYNTGVMNAPEAVVFPGHTTTEWSLAVSVFAIGGPFGAILAGKVSNVKGRRVAIVSSAWIFLLGGAILASAVSMLWIIVARFIIGFASGFASVIVPIYLGELAPPTLRGTLGTMTQFSIVIGILASNLLAFPFATLRGWRVLFGVTPFIVMIQLLCSPLIYESPRWLLNQDEYSLEARVAIKKLRGFREDSDVQLEVDFIVHASKMQRLKQDSAHSGGAVWDLLTDKSVRRLVVGFTVLHMAQQLSGSNAVFYYSTSFFQGVIENPLVGTALASTVNLFATFGAVYLMDRAGRVPLLLWSAGGMFVCAGFITLTLLGFVPKLAALFGVMGFVCFFAVGLGPIPWLIVAEMFDAKYVATAMSVACQINWICNFIVGIAFPYINAALGPWSFTPFCGVLALTFLYVWWRLPETAGRTVAEVQKMVRSSSDKDAKLRQGMNGNGGIKYVVVEGADFDFSAN